MSNIWGFCFIDKTRSIKKFRRWDVPRSITYTSTVYKRKDYIIENKEFLVGLVQHFSLLKEDIYTF